MPKGARPAFRREWVGPVESPRTRSDVCHSTLPAAAISASARAAVTRGSLIAGSRRLERAGMDDLEASAWNRLIGHSAERIWDLGSLIEGLAHGHWGRVCAHRAGPLLSAGGADADCRATRQVACCRARCPASAPAPVITSAGAPLPACMAAPRVPPVRTLLTTASAGDGQELISRRAGHSGPSGGGRRGAEAFTRRPSAAVRRRRTGSILAVSVVPRRRTAPHRYARIAILATAARCRRRCRRPAACRRG